MIDARISYTFQYGFYSPKKSKVKDIKPEPSDNIQKDMSKSISFNTKEEAVAYSNMFLADYENQINWIAYAKIMKHTHETIIKIK